MSLSPALPASPAFYAPHAGIALASSSSAAAVAVSPLVRTYSGRRPLRPPPVNAAVYRSPASASGGGSAGSSRAAAAYASAAGEKASAAGGSSYYAASSTSGRYPASPRGGSSSTERAAPLSPPPSFPIASSSTPPPVRYGTVGTQTPPPSARRRTGSASASNSGHSARRGSEAEAETSASISGRSSPDTSAEVVRLTRVGAGGHSGGARGVAGVDPNSFPSPRINGGSSSGTGSHSRSSRASRAESVMSTGSAHLSAVVSTAVRRVAISRPETGAARRGPRVGGPPSPQRAVPVEQRERSSRGGDWPEDAADVDRRLLTPRVESGSWDASAAEDTPGRSRREEEKQPVPRAAAAAESSAMAARKAARALAPIDVGRSLGRGPAPSSGTSPKRPSPSARSKSNIELLRSEAEISSSSLLSPASAHAQLSVSPAHSSARLSPGPALSTLSHSPLGSGQSLADSSWSSNGGASMAGGGMLGLEWGTSIHSAPASRSHTRVPSLGTSIGARSIRTRTSAAPSKMALLDSLDASLALVDAQAYEQLPSLEAVEASKKELARLERRMQDMRLKLKVETRVREAAVKLRRAGAPRPGHSRTLSSSSTGRKSNMGSTDLPPTPSTPAGVLPSLSSDAGAAHRQADEEVGSATRKVDAVAQELLVLVETAAARRRQLMEHQAGVLAARVQELESLVAEREDGEADEDARPDSPRVALREAVNANSRTRELEDQLLQAETALKERQDADDAARERADELQRRLDTSERALELARAQTEAFGKAKSREDEATVVELQRRLDAADARARDAEARADRWQTDAKALSQRLEERDEESTRALRDRETQLASARQDAAAAQRLVSTRTEDATRHEAAQKATALKLRDLELEVAAERRLMHERAELFVAFERRLENAERRLRAEDERCARVLGKDEGREEMDDFLAQIKGYGGVKKAKTAGQDIDALLDSLAVHITDLADETTRLASARGDVSYDSTQHDAAAATQVRELEVELQDTERELERWRSEAESAKRQLAAQQRASVAASSRGGAERFSRMPEERGNAQMLEEMAVRLALAEKRSVALEAELRDASSRVGDAEKAASTDSGSTGDSPVKVAGSADAEATARRLRYAETQLAHCRGAITAVLELLPPAPALRAALLDATRNEESLGALQRAFAATARAAHSPLLATTTSSQQLQQHRGSLQHRRSIVPPYEDAPLDAEALTERVRAVLAAGRGAAEQACALLRERDEAQREAHEAQNRERELGAQLERKRTSPPRSPIEASRGRERKL
jgi:hypothetical protein